MVKVKVGMKEGEMKSRQHIIEKQGIVVKRHLVSNFFYCHKVTATREHKWLKKIKWWTLRKKECW